MLAARRELFMVAWSVLGDGGDGGIQNAVSVAGVAAETKIESPGANQGNQITNRMNDGVSMMEVPGNVKQFVTACSAIVADFEKKKFQGQVLCDLKDRSSPIEQLFETALMTLSAAIECVSYMTNSDEAELCELLETYR